MLTNFLRRDAKERVDILIISAACCAPGMAPLDEQARRVIDQVLSETGVEAQVKVVPATNAFLGAVPKPVMAELISRAQSGQLPAPAVLVNGKAVAFGLAELGNFKSALLALTATEYQITKKEKPDESSA